jgi:hypothetical protein
LGAGFVLGESAPPEHIVHHSKAPAQTFSPVPAIDVQEEVLLSTQNYRLEDIDYSICEYLRNFFRDTRIN